MTRKSSSRNLKGVAAAAVTIYQRRRGARQSTRTFADQNSPTCLGLNQRTLQPLG